MKRALLVLILLSNSLDVSADEHRGHHHSSGDWWVAPAIIGGAAAITYGLLRPVPAPPPVYYNLYSTYPEYHYEWIYDRYCGCQRQILIPNH